MNLKTSRLLLCTLLLVSVACSTREDRLETGIIIDNRTPAAELNGPWTLLSSGSAYDGECAWAPLWKNPADGSIDPAYAASAVVRPPLPQPGMYEVFAWWCDAGDKDLATRQLVWLCASRGYSCSWATINPRENAGRWNSLGTFYLDTDADLTVRNGERNLGAPPGLEIIADGSVLFDAFRFVYRSPATATLTPLPFQPQPSPAP